MTKYTEIYFILLRGLTNAVSRAPQFVILCTLLVTAVSGIYLFKNFQINTDNEDMLSAQLPFRQDSISLSSEFPSYSDNLLVVIDGDSPSLADDAARVLYTELQLNPEVFGEVYFPSGDKFFRKNGLLFLTVDELYTLSIELAAVQPLLGVLQHDTNLRGFSKILALTIAQIDKDKKTQEFDLSSVLNSVAEIAENQAGGRNSTLSWDNLVLSKKLKAEGLASTRRFLILRPNLNFASLKPGKRAMDEVRKLAVARGLTPEKGVRVRLTGSAALATEELESVEEGMGVAGLVSIALVATCLCLGLGSISYVATILLTLLVGLIWTSAFAIAIFGSFNLISIAFAVLFIGLGADFGIHYVLRYHEEKRLSLKTKNALSNTVTNSGGPLTLCAFTSAIAFYSFLPTDYLGLAQLGMIAGTGMFFALAVSFILLPALLQIFPSNKSELKKRNKSKFNVVLTLPIQYYRVISIGLVLLTAGALLLLPKIQFDFDPLNLKDKNKESVSTLFDIHQSGKPIYSIKILAPNLKIGQMMTGQLQVLASVDRVESIDTFIAKNQEEKISIINDIGLFLLPSLQHSEKKKSLEHRDRLLAIANILNNARIISQGSKNAVLRDSAIRLISAIHRLPKTNASIQNLEISLISGFSAKVDILRDALEAEIYDISDLPGHIRERMISRNGKSRLEIFSKEDLTDRAALTQFVNEVRSVAPRATGSPVVILEAGRTVIKAFIEAGVLSFSLILLVLIAVLRHFKLALLAFMPVCCAGVLTFGTAVLCNISLNFANIIVLPLLFGLTIDFSLHLILRMNNQEKLRNLFETSTPRAVTISAFTTISSFGSIMLSSHPGTASMGLLLIIALAFGLLCSLTFIPAIHPMLNCGKKL